MKSQEYKREGYINPIPTTDIIIEYNDGKKEGIILITRKNPPYGFAIPGGFTEVGLTLEDNARKEAGEETGLEIIIENEGRPYVFSNPNRDPRGHMISNTYFAKGTGELKAGDDAASAKLYSIDEVVDMLGKRLFAFDHEEILKTYLREKGYIKNEKNGNRYGRVGVIGRFKPLHNGSALMLETLCESAEHVIIGIGSTNKYNARNPFTPEETKEMIDSYLSSRFSNYSFVLMPDFAHIPEYSDGKKWAADALQTYNNLDAFVTGNDYVAGLLGDYYRIIHPADIIPREKWIWSKGSIVRMAMARGGNGWKNLVPKEVAQYLEQHNLVERFRIEFGLEILVSLGCTDYIKNESPQEEKAHTKEV